MIEMPLNVDPQLGNGRKITLNVALTKLRTFDAVPKKLLSETNRYIRPIMLVQLEGTGADQREGGYMHAEDVKDWLLTSGFDQSEEVIKTAKQNDLKASENKDFLSPTYRIRAIIAKQALQECRYVKYFLQISFWVVSLTHL